MSVLAGGGGVCIEWLVDGLFMHVYPGIDREQGSSDCVA